MSLNQIRGEQIKNNIIVNAHVNVSAAIVESKLSLAYGTAALSSAISTEASLRASADTINGSDVSAALSTEVSNRISADTAASVADSTS